MTNNLELLKNHLYKLIKEELEGGEEEKQAGFEKVMYDLVLEPADIQDALSALSDIKNYGIYANNLRDPKVIAKIFGPSVPATKGRVAKETWDSMNDTEKNSKVIDIKNRAPQDWTKVEEKLKDKFDEWSIENDNDSFNEFIVSLSSSELPMEFFGKYASTFYPMKTPDNLKKYSGVMAKDKDFVVDGDKIVFPQKKNPFETKDYLTKVLKTIMGNAKLQYSISQKESDDQPATTSNAQGAVEKINFVKTFDTPELAKKFMKLIPKDFAPKTELEGSKIIVSDITDSQKKNLIASALQFIASQPKKPMKESIKDQIRQAVMEVLQEKKLTKAEKNKKEDIVKAMAKQGAPKDSKTYAIATAKAKKLAEGEGDTSMDDILDAFQAALAIEDDAKADQALKAVYNALKDKVKSKAGDLYQKARVGFAKSQGIDPSELSEAWVNSNTEDRISYLKPVLQHVWNMGKGNNMIDFDSMAENIVSDLFDDTLNEAEEDTIDTITMDVPLFIRMLEYAREDASADVDLHDVAENAVSLNKDQEVLSMDDYDALLPSDAEPMDEARFEKGEDIGKKGKGFAKIAKSAAKQYGSEEAGKKVAGAILKKVMKEAEDEPINLPTAIQTRANSKVIDAKSLAKILKDIYTQIQSKESIDFSKNQNIKYVLAYLDKAMNEKPVAKG
jgi:uncharacterized protein (DUF2267 family)